MSKKSQTDPCEKSRDERGENITTIYSLRFRKAPHGEVGERQQGVVGNPYHGSRNTPPPVVGNSYPQETSTQDVSLSNIRKATSNEITIGNPRTTKKEPEAIAKPQHIAAQIAIPSSPLPSGEAQRGGDVAHIGQTLQRKHSHLISPPKDEEAHEAIKSYISEMARKLHDEAPLISSTTRAFNLYQRAGVHLGLFLNLVYDAEKEATRRSESITKLTSRGFKNRMAYFFAVLEDKLGLRQPATMDRGQ
jgi:hypothetical protein